MGKQRTIEIPIFSDAVSPLEEFSNSTGTEYSFYLDDSGVVLVMEMVLIGGLKHMLIPNIPFVSVDKNRLAFSVREGTLTSPEKLTITSTVFEFPKKESGQPKYLGRLDYEMQNGGPCGIQLVPGSLKTTETVHRLQNQIQRNLSNTNLLTQITNESGYSKRRVNDLSMKIEQNSGQNLLYVRLR